MIEKSTVLILGAGASKPYSYPLGIELKNMIIKELKGMIKPNSGWISELGFDHELVSEFISDFAMSPRPSIDSFLAYQKEEFEEIGKIAIVDAISKRENMGNFPPETDDWYTYFARFLYDCSFENIGDNNVGIISYNYDRSLESFLYYSLLASYKEGDFSDQCVPKIKEIPIIHMYGRLDPLTWENKVGRGYGDECSNQDLLKISKNINLIHETKEKNIIKQANDLIEKADRIYFLGLDLRNKENLEILDVSLLAEKEGLITTYGLRPGEINQIKLFIRNRARTNRLKIAHYNDMSLEAIRTNTPFE